MVIYWWQEAKNKGMFGNTENWPMVVKEREEICIHQHQCATGCQDANVLHVGKIFFE